MRWQGRIAADRHVETMVKDVRMKRFAVGEENRRLLVRAKERAILPIAAPLGLILAYAPAAFAQGPLEQLPNQNPAQQDMAKSIDTVCPSLVQRQNISRSPDEIDLQQTCTRMIDTAREVGQQPRAGYGLTTDQTNNALQSINGEEVQAAQQQTGDIQASNISGRLEAIRSGAVGRGLSIASLRLGSGSQLASVGDYGRYSSDGPLMASATASDAPISLAQGEESEAWFGPWGVFLTGSVTFGNKDATGKVDGFDFVLPGVTAGADYQVSQNFILGGAFGFSHYDADFDATVRSPSGQSLKSNSYTLSVFASYFFGKRFYADAIGTVGYTGYESTRRIVIPSQNPAFAPMDRIASGDFDAIQYSLTANIGYQYAFRGVELEPVARLRYLAAGIKGFTEAGADGLNLAYSDQDVDSLTTRLGLQASYAVSTPIGVVVPYARGEYVHEFLNDNDGAPVRYAADPTGLSEFVITTEDPDRNYGELGAGVALTLPQGWVTFLDYAAVVGFADFAIHTVAAGLRKDF